MEREPITPPTDDSQQLSAILKGLVRAILNGTPSDVLQVTPAPLPPDGSAKG